MKKLNLTTDDVKHIAKLANLIVDESQLVRLQKQLADTLTYVQKLQEVDTKSIVPTAQVNGLSNITREDEIKQCLTQQEALANAKDSYNGFFRVKAIFED